MAATHHCGLHGCTMNGAMKETQNQKRVKPSIGKFLVFLLLLVSNALHAPLRIDQPPKAFPTPPSRNF
ncbi:hypothetical protein L195_g022703 [Trifolium pratense]|uniref:Uncharacterized protein n=1 Tax=Trifolium pratense TaxID=57577 RepID=A0A2K3N8S8_TRIPR|nr:hypothetical protein L195_g022703 [Trifolium pratense]